MSTSESPTSSQATPCAQQSEAFAWAVFAENGNLIIWSKDRHQVEPAAQKYGRPVVPIIALSATHQAAAPTALAILRDVHDTLAGQADSDIDHFEDDDEEREAAPMQYAARKVMEVMQMLEAAKSALPPTTVTLELPPLDDELVAILGRPNFMCAGIADRMREMGHTIKTKAEYEQAAVIHLLLGYFLKYGAAEWADRAANYLDPKNSTLGQPA